MDNKTMLTLDPRENGFIEWLRDEKDPPTWIKLRGLKDPMTFLVAWMECTICLALFMFHLMCIATLRGIVSRMVYMIWKRGELWESPLWVQQGSEVIAYALDATYVLYQLITFYASNFHFTPTAFLRRIGLNRLCVSSLTKAVILYNIGGFLVMLSTQYFGCHSLLTVENYFTSTSMDGEGNQAREHIDWGKTIEIVAWSPLKEEILFRCLVFHLLYNRIPSRWICVLLSSIFFGVAHLINLRSSSFSFVYVLLQTFLGVQIGMFYSLTYMKSGCLWEVVFLHVVNNAVASTVSSQAMQHFSNPIVILTLTHSLIFYGALLRYLMKTGILEEKILYSSPKSTCISKPE